MIDNEIFTFVRAFFALAFVIGLFLLLTMVVRKTGLDKHITGNRGGIKHLSIIETTYLDPKHRLVLVKCDNKEHLLLIGATHDLLIESRVSGGIDVPH